MLQKYVYDPKHVIRFEEVTLSPDLNYEEKPVRILDRKIKVLKNKEIAHVKVLRNHHDVEEATWEIEDKIRAKYPDLEMGGK